MTTPADILIQANLLMEVVNKSERTNPMITDRSPIIAIIHNLKENRWHPIYFLWSPLPSEDADDKLVRHKSKAHHTTGFATRDEALNSAKGELAKIVSDIWGEPGFSLDEDMPWDGEDVPAMVAFFFRDGEGFKRAM